jgi:hypothetical protein
MEKQESKIRFPTFPQPLRLRTITSYGIRILSARSDRSLSRPPCFFYYSQLDVDTPIKTPRYCNKFHCSDKDADTYMNTRSQSGRTPRETPVRLPCACANLRKASLVATQFYDAVLRPSGLRVTQFTLLQALNRAPGISQKNLAELLGVDSTTLTRTLAGLRRKEWLRSETEPTDANFGFFSWQRAKGSTSACFPIGSWLKNASGRRWARGTGIR